MLRKIFYWVKYRRVRRIIIQSGLFDPAWYLENYSDISGTGNDPLTHYLLHGAKELRNPSPLFNAAQYVEQHRNDPDVLKNPLLHYIRTAPPQEPTKRTAEENRKIALLAAEFVGELATFEPDLSGLTQSLKKCEVPIIEGIRRDKAAAAWRKLFASFEQAYERIIFVPWLMRGDADLVAAHAAKAAIEKYGIDSLLVVITDSHRTEARDWLPPSTHLCVLSDYDPTLSFPDRVEITSWIIQALKPKSLLNVNSRACWEAIRIRGAAFATFTDLYAGLFCHDYNDDGEAIGYADAYFRQTFKHLKGVLLDNKTFADELAAQFAIRKSDSNKLHTVYQPAPSGNSLTAALSAHHEPFPVMWAGRLCRQKNIQLLLQIAKKDAGFKYEIFGAGEESCNTKFTRDSESISNLIWHGSYPSFESLPTEKFGAFLYTTLWDGLPNVLLAAARAGLAIVASNRGGIAELIDETTGWLIDDFNNPDAYIAALNAIRAHPDEARRRSIALRHRLDQKHSWEAYMNAMLTSPSFLV
ncbi:MAG: glycosyltransferase [Burkholderiaceae bacterium]|jgi:glycosyltransferase involved in cell wall biosynthesis|nr:glycosyltransferase [Burkholderiaceae bacterium]